MTNKVKSRYYRKENELLMSSRRLCKVMLTGEGDRMECLRGARVREGKRRK
jgi:hypothetical protein